MCYTSIEICAGAGGQALGLEQAGFQHELLIEYEKDYCLFLQKNRPKWNVQCADVRFVDGFQYRDSIDLLAGGVPCPPFSIAGKQLGSADDRDLFPHMIRLVQEINPRAVMIENVRGLLDKKFEGYRTHILSNLRILGYQTHISLINASAYGVSQLRPRVVIVGIRNDLDDTFEFPAPHCVAAPSVGQLLKDLMAENGWRGASSWSENACGIAPTIVGGSKKHGGPDLGPTRAKAAWLKLGVDGSGIAKDAPSADAPVDFLPKLTPRMIARIQGFPDEWQFGEKKTLACRMIGNAFPPPVAKSVGLQIQKVLIRNDRQFNRSRCS